LKAEEYAARIAIDKPYIAIAMADEIPIQSTTKRIAISLKRTYAWFAEIVAYNLDKKPEEKIDWESTALFGVVPGYMEEESLDEYTSNLFKSGAKGTIITISMYSQTKASSYMATLYYIIL
jgi:queuine/archaeosine tRNA-ribosyltransferase